MEEAIKLAIEGGWRENYPAQCSWSEYEHTVLDPLFWQALGRALGWKGNICDRCWKVCGPSSLDSCEECGTSGMYKRAWEHHALRFFDLKLTGGDEEAYWKELIN